MKRLGFLILASACADGTLSGGRGSPAALGSAWERERRERILQDHPLTRRDLLEQLAKRVRRFQPEELDRWEAEGRLEAIGRGDSRRYLNCAVSNLFFRYPELRARAIGAKLYTPLARGRDPVRFHVEMTLAVHADAVPAGRTVRAWLPFPQAYEAQTDIRSDVDPPPAPMRAAYFEKTAEAGRAVVFRLQYEFTRHPVLVRFGPALAHPASDTSRPHDAEQPYLAEQPPHIVFTPELRDLSRRVLGAETNPLVAARRLYDWCGENIHYSYAREYSTVPNLSESCFRDRFGDCGMIALLFMTLCRMNGIPARWQSGWVIPPGAENMHDWCEIWIDPCGWIPVDPYMPQAMKHADALSEAEKAQVKEYYFGGLDPYRLVFNRDHGAPLVPPKKSWRSDTVDFQRGEVEWDENNLYIDKFDYSLRARIISP